MNRLRKNQGLRKDPVASSSSAMSDIAMMLIFFFMVTSVFAARKGLDLTTSEDLAPQVTDRMVTVTVETEGQILVGDREVGSEDLLEALEPHLRNGASVLLITDDLVPYGSMVGVYDRILRAGLPVEDGGLGMDDLPGIFVPTRHQIHRARSASLP